MAVNLFDSFRNIYEIEDDIKSGNWNLVKEKSIDSILKCAKMYIFLEGIEPVDEEEILNEFVSRIVSKKWLCNDWTNIKENYIKWKFAEATKETALESYNYTKIFVNDCDKSYLRLQPNLKIMECAKNNGDGNDPPRRIENSLLPDEILDLKGVACPFNYVRAKLKLETMEIGKTLEVILDDGAPINNVPRSLKQDGHSILLEEKINLQNWKIFVKKEI
jgi:TusA-related sulfurtransferase